MITLSHTSLQAFRRCPRFYSWRHLERIEADRPPTRALGLGRLWHEVLDTLTGNVPREGSKLQAAILHLGKMVGDDRLAAATVLAMLSGWINHHGMPPERQSEFPHECAMRNPRGGWSPSKRYTMKMDGLQALDLDLGDPVEHALWEHKTVSSMGDHSRWSPIRDQQVMLYVAYSPVPITRIVYDVIERPTWKTRENDAAEQIALLNERYVNCWTSRKRRKKDEPVDELMARRAEDGQPYMPYARTVWDVDTSRVRMAQQDAWDTAQEVAACTRRGRFPRALAQCSRGFYGRECEYSMLCHQAQNTHHQETLIEAFYRSTKRGKDSNQIAPGDEPADEKERPEAITLGQPEHDLRPAQGGQDNLCGVDSGSYLSGH